MVASGIQALPADLFHLLSAELSERLDFPTLYNCIVSSKQIASAGAINALYRISHFAPVKGGGQELPLAEQQLTVARWSILWRTLALSSLDQTIYPYCKHLRYLDLRDLGHLLEDDKFRGKVSKHFFSGELSRFHFSQQTPGKGRGSRLDTRKIIIAIGDEITKQSPLLEALSEPTDSSIFSIALLDWAPRLAHLKQLEFYDGKALADEKLRNLLHAHCPNLSSLRIYHSANEDADHQLANFISGMRENTLAHFENLNNCHVGAETCLALNGHGKSLQSLKLALTEEGVQALALLQGCTTIETLALSSFRPSVDLKATENDVYLAMLDWLKNCTQLKDVSFNNFISAPDLLLPVLLDNEKALQKLQITAVEGAMYIVKDHHDFHQALSQQQSLQSLHLNADPEPMTRDDIEILMNTFCSLTDLRLLRLHRISDYFTEGHIALLAQHLPDLEELLIGGYGLSDLVLPGLATLSKLKALTLSGITAFTEKGLLDFVARLGEGNHALILSVDMANPEPSIPTEGQDTIRQAIFDKLDGRFEYQLIRDPDAPDFYSSDDSD